MPNPQDPKPTFAAALPSPAAAPRAGLPATAAPPEAGTTQAIGSTAPLGRVRPSRVLWLAAGLVVLVAVVVRVWHINTLGYNSDEAVYGGQGASLGDDPALKPYFPTFRAHPLLFQMLLSVGYRLGIGEIFGRLASAALGVLTVLVVL